MVPPVFSSTGKNFTTGTSTALNFQSSTPSAPRGASHFFSRLSAEGGVGGGGGAVDMGPYGGDGGRGGGATRGNWGGASSMSSRWSSASRGRGQRCFSSGLHVYHNGKRSEHFNARPRILGPHPDAAGRGARGFKLGQNAHDAPGVSRRLEIERAKQLRHERGLGKRQ